MAPESIISQPPAAPEMERPPERYGTIKRARRPIRCDKCSTIVREGGRYVQVGLYERVCGGCDDR